jgi:plastocyanin
MQTKIIWTIAVVLVVILGGWYAFSARPAAAPTIETEKQEEATNDTASAPTVITYTDTGFSPATVTVRVGDTVRFTNASSGGMWVGSDNHPTHTEYDDTSTRDHCVGGVAVRGAFDECNASASGASWTFTFTKAGTFGYHNHTSAGKTGTIVVQ